MAVATEEIRLCAKIEGTVEICNVSTGSLDM
jgi:hypothetical protein